MIAGDSTPAEIFDGPAQRNQKLQECPAKNQQRDVEVDRETRDVDESSDEGSGCARGIEAESLQNERKHGACEGPERDDARQRDSDRQREQIRMRVLSDAEVLPEQDSSDAHHSENR